MSARIFIVEDEALIAMELRDRLEKLGYQVAGSAARGEDAAARIAADPPDLVLMDVKLAGDLDGVETAERIRARHDVPVVFLTAFADDRLLGRVRETLPYGYLVKPFEERTLFATVEMALHRSRLEQQVRESELRYRTLFEGAGDAIFILEAEGASAGAIVDANQAAAGMHGCTVEELRGMNIRDLDAPEAAAEAGALIKRMLKGEWIKKELYHRRKDGSLFPVEISAGLLAVGDRKYVLAFDRDISDRKRADEELRQSEQRLREAQSIGRMGNWELDLAGNRLHWSDEIFRIFEIDSERFEASYEAFLNAVHPDDRAAVNEAYQASLRDREPYSIVHRLLMPDGRVKYVHERCESDFDAKGRPIRSLGTVQDVTAQKQAEAALRRLNRALRTLSECNKMIVRAESEAGLLQDICNVVVDTGGYRMAWVGYAEQDEKKTVRPFRQCGYENGYLESIRISWEDNTWGRGPTGTAIRTGTVAVVRDIRNDPLFAPWLEEASRRGYASIIGLPLKDGPKVLGALTIYAAERDAFDADEIELLTELAENMSFGITALRTRVARIQAEEELRQNYQTQSVINELLRISLRESDLPGVLQSALELILSIPWISFESRGCIYLSRVESDELVMTAEKNMEAFRRERCSVVRHGYCICGRAAERKEIVFADRMDERHDIVHEGDVPHGHYCVPILRGDVLLGVINIYVREKHARSAKEEAFLSVVANVLSGIIQRKQAEQERELLVADLRKALETVSRSQKEWMATFDGIGDMISIHDRDCTVIKANKAFADYHGLSPREIVNRKCYDLMHGARGPVDRCPFVRTMESKEAHVEEILDPGTGRVFRVATYPYHGPEGSLLGVIHIARDITEERQREERLILSERLASLGQMASGIAHEINNPLASIAGCSEGLLARARDERFDRGIFEKYLNIIQEEVFRCKNITTSMLSFVRKNTYERKYVDINHLVEKTLEIIGFQGRLKNVEVRKCYGAELPPVLASEGELRQVFLVLIINALDAMEDKGVLTVETRSGEGKVVLLISDNGPGIRREDHDRIFVPFFTTKQDKGGTGLGLSIARRIIDNHNGAIEVVSSGSEGSVFSVALSVTPA